MCIRDRFTIVNMEALLAAGVVGAVVLPDPKQEEEEEYSDSDYDYESESDSDDSDSGSDSESDSDYDSNSDSGSELDSGSEYDSDEDPDYEEAGTESSDEEEAAGSAEPQPIGRRTRGGGRYVFNINNNEEALKLAQNFKECHDDACHPWEKWDQCLKRNGKKAEREPKWKQFIRKCDEDAAKLRAMRDK